MADVNSQEKVGKTIVIGKKKILIVAAVVVIILVVAAFILLTPSGKTDYSTAEDPVLGNASISVIEFSDYECPFCQAAEGTNQEVIASLKQSDPTWQAPVPSIIQNYVDTGKVRLVFRQFPVHGDDNPALASKCAQEQGMFWQYHSTLFGNYTALSLSDLKRYAAVLSLNITQFDRCLDSQKYLADVQKDLSDGQALGVSGTPTFFIGNDAIGYQKVVGAQSFSAFKQVIDSIV